MITLQHLNLKYIDLKRKVDYLLYISSQGGGGGSTSAATLTGTTIASNVINSSLTSVGTITSGTWEGSPIASEFLTASGIDDVLAVDQALTTDHEIDLNAHTLYFRRLSDNSGVLFTPGTPISNGGNLFSVILNGDIIARINDQGESNFGLSGNYPAGLFITLGSEVRIGDWDGEVNGTKIRIDDSGQQITYTSGTHTFNGLIITNTDIEITDLTKGLILKSPDSTRWRININNTGALTTTSL